MPQISNSIDDILQSTATGSLDKAILNNLRGFNHMQIPSAVPSNKEQHGFTFIVRPQLNMQLDNIRNSRKFMPLAADVSDITIHRFVRTTLDPRLMVGYHYGNTVIPKITCPLVDNHQAFIPVLTNNIRSSSGWPDPVVHTFASREGRYKESYLQVDGLVENFSQYDIDMTFRNTVADPILYLFYMWTLYASYVFSGKFVPYPDFISDQRIDYNTRIFRVILDRNRQKVTKIMSTGPAIPVASSVGQFADFNLENPFSEQNKDITMRFRCMAFEMFDDILIKEFNDIGCMFQSKMLDENRAGQMILVPPVVSHLFQHRAYPRIDPDTHAMEWWVERGVFNARTEVLLQTLSVSEINTVRQASNPELVLEPQEDAG